MTTIWLIVAVAAGSGLLWLIDQWIVAPRKPAVDGAAAASPTAEYAGYVFLIACGLLFLLLKRSPQYAASVELYPIVVFAAIVSSAILILDVAMFAHERAALNAARPQAAAAVRADGHCLCPCDLSRDALDAGAAFPRERRAAAVGEFRHPRIWPRFPLRRLAGEPAALDHRRRETAPAASDRRSAARLGARPRCGGFSPPKPSISAWCSPFSRW